MGKVFTFPDGAVCPTDLHVNPCGLILTTRPGTSDDDPDHVRFKSRLIVDLARGLVNSYVPEVPVSYGTVELAVTRIKSGDFVLSWT